VSYEKAINEIQGLLTQTGIPPGHAQDIAARLSSAMSLYYDYRVSGGGGDNSSTNLENISRANSEGAAFRNRFGSPEEDRKPGLAGQAGKDGLGAYAWAVGGTGAAGQDGQDGQQGQAGQDGVTTFITVGGGVDLSGIYKAFNDLMKRVDKLDNQDKPKDSDCCKKLKERIDKLAKNVTKNEKDIQEAEKDIKSIQRMLRDTVEC
jgi:hypothetical protein